MFLFLVIVLGLNTACDVEYANGNKETVMRYWKRKKEGWDNFNINMADQSHWISYAYPILSNPTQSCIFAMALHIVNNVI